METLMQMKCVACRAGEPTVTDAEIAEFHPQVSDWEIVELDAIKRLTRVYPFDDFAQALEFTNKVGELADEEGHHPALLTEWGRTTVTWYFDGQMDRAENYETMELALARADHIHGILVRDGWTDVAEPRLID